MESGKEGTTKKLIGTVRKYVDMCWLASLWPPCKIFLTKDLYEKKRLFNFFNEKAQQENNYRQVKV